MDCLVCLEIPTHFLSCFSLLILSFVDFTKASKALLYADSIAPERVSIVQSISGTGALRLGGEFLAKFFPIKTSTFSLSSFISFLFYFLFFFSLSLFTLFFFFFLFHSSHRLFSVYVCDPTWGNHNKLFGLSGLTVKKYRYFHPETLVRNSFCSPFSLVSLFLTLLFFRDWISMEWWRIWRLLRPDLLFSSTLLPITLLVLTLPESNGRSLLI